MTPASKPAVQPAQIFHALGDPTRLRLFERISAGPVSVSALANPLQLSLAATVQHLQVLERTGLIRTCKQGRVRTCRLEPQALLSIEQWIDSRRQSWNAAFDRLGDLLSESQ
jgi:DNA-binding transcriptional ArsR family regulator